MVFFYFIQQMSDYVKHATSLKSEAAGFDFG